MWTVFAVWYRLRGPITDFQGVTMSNDVESQKNKPGAIHSQVPSLLSNPKAPVRPVRRERTDGARSAVRTTEHMNVRANPLGDANFEKEETVRPLFFVSYSRFQGDFFFTLS